MHVREVAHAGACTVRPQASQQNSRRTRMSYRKDGPFINSPAIQRGKWIFLVREITVEFAATNQRSVFSTTETPAICR